MNKKIVFTLVFLFGISVYHYFSSGKNTQGLLNDSNDTISYSKFLDLLNKDEVVKINLNNNLAKIETKDAKLYKFTYPINDIEFIKELKEKNVDISVKGPESGSGFGMFFMIFILFIFLYFLFKSPKNQNESNSSSGGMGQGPFAFGKSKARMILPEEGTVTFADVAGIDEAKDDVLELVDFLKDSTKFSKLGAKIPKGCLLVGPPGTGKTLLAKAIAGEAKVPFFSISGSDFVEMFVGVGASRVRDLFSQAKKKSPCIIFIDEIDAVGRQRGVGVGGGNDEREQTLNQLLVEMDGFTTNSGIIVIAATNRSDVLDKALLRPGRFDRQVMVPLPDVVGREKILQVYVSKIPVSNDVDINVIARGTTGFSGADLANLVNEAAILAAKHNKSTIGMKDFDEAKDKIIMGSERKSSKMSEDDRKLTAYHEAGHALVSFKVDGFYPVHKVTIIPRGSSMGVTSFLPEKDEYNKSYKQLVANLAVLFGGRVAEELIFGKENITTGASMDIQMATNLATRMVTEWGFSDKLGRIRYLNSNPSYYRETSDLSVKEIEDEVRMLISQAEKTAYDVLTQNSQSLELISQALLQFETLSGEEAKRVCEGELIQDIRGGSVAQRQEEINKNEESINDNMVGLPKID